MLFKFNKFFLGCFLFVTSAFVASAAQAASDASLKSSDSSQNIVVSNPYIQDIISNITCESSPFKVTSLLKTGNDPHTFSLAPDDRKAIANAQLVIYIGKALEPWIFKISKSEKQVWLSLTDGMDLRKLDSSDEDTDQAKTSSELEDDDHIWQSPKHTKEAVQKINLTLQKLYPEQKDQFSRCTDIYLAKIDAQVAYLKSKIATIPEQNRVLATNHDAFGYFTSELGLGSLSIMGLSDEASVTLDQLTNLISELQKKKVTAIFLESTGNMKNIQTVSRETGVKIGGTLYGDSLGAPGTGADTVLGMWSTNVDTIRASLGAK